MADSKSTKILLVDDEENILISISYLLRKEGYHVLTANNGSEGVEMFLLHKPDIILLDVMMPIMDGFTTAEKIRALDITSQANIIFLTAKGTSDDRKVGYLSGADDYIVKPFDNNILLEKISEKVK